MSTEAAARPLSAVLITFNPGDQLAVCLKSLAFADEIVVVDSGSDDDSQAVAKQHGARVIEHAWRGFGPQKRFAVEQAANDWVLCIDADEQVPPELAATIRETLRDPGHGAYEMPRTNRFMGRYLRHGEGYPDWSLRLFDRRHAQWSDDLVHEKVVTDGRVGRLRSREGLLHNSAESLTVYLEKQNRYTSLQAEALAAAGENPSFVRLLLSPALRFFKFYVLRLGFLDGLPGLVHIAIGCFNSFAKYAKLRALQVQPQLEAGEVRRPRTRFERQPERRSGPEPKSTNPARSPARSAAPVAGSNSAPNSTSSSAPTPAPTFAPDRAET